MDDGHPLECQMLSKNINCGSIERKKIYRKESFSTHQKIIIE